MKKFFIISNQVVKPQKNRKESKEDIRNENDDVRDPTIFNRCNEEK